MPDSGLCSRFVGASGTSLMTAPSLGPLLGPHPLRPPFHRAALLLDHPTFRASCPSPAQISLFWNCVSGLGHFVRAPAPYDNRQVMSHVRTPRSSARGWCLGALLFFSQTALFPRAASRKVKVNLEKGGDPILSPDGSVEDTSHPRTFRTANGVGGWEKTNECAN